jgi:hypothetical protein
MAAAALRVLPGHDSAPAERDRQLPVRRPVARVVVWAGPQRQPVCEAVSAEGTGLMTQHLDDVTGTPLRPLTARERDLQREALIAMVNAQTGELNRHTAALRELRDRLDAQGKRIDALELQVAWLSQPTWLARALKRVW